MYRNPQKKSELKFCLVSVKRVVNYFQFPMDPSY